VKQFLLAGTLGGIAKPFVYWNKNDEKWVGRDKATKFTSEEMLEYTLPDKSMGWVEYNSLYKSEL
jgi:hypothetical protein